MPCFLTSCEVALIDGYLALLYWKLNTGLYINRLYCIKKEVNMHPYKGAVYMMIQLHPNKGVLLR